MKKIGPRYVEIVNYMDGTVANYFINRRMVYHRQGDDTYHVNHSGHKMAQVEPLADGGFLWRFDNYTVKRRITNDEFERRLSSRGEVREVFMFVTSNKETPHD